MGRRRIVRVLAFLPWVVSLGLLALVLRDGGTTHRRDPVPPSRAASAPVAAGPAGFAAGGAAAGDLLALGGTARSDIYVMDTEGGSPVRLTAGELQGTEPAWFPDSQHVAFFTYRTPPGQPGGLWAAGTGSNEAPRPFWRGHSVTFSPDGQLAAAASGCGAVRPEGGLYLIHLDSDAATPVDGSDELCFLEVAWSPDGQRIAASVQTGGGAPISLVTVEVLDGATGAVAPLLDGLAGPDVSWSPDGTRLAVRLASSAGGSGVVAIVDAALGTATPVAPGPGALQDVARVDWSPREERLALVTASADPPQSSLSVLDLATGDALPLLDAPRDGLGPPRWSPDGTRLAVALTRDRDTDIYVVAADGGGVTRLTDGPARDTAPAWSPDGLRLAFTSDRDGQNGIYRIPLDGGVPALVGRWPRPGDQPTTPVLSPDGRRLAWDQDGDLFVSELDGSGRTNVTSTAGRNEHWPQWSADGASLAFLAYGATGPAQLEVIGAGGSGRRLALEAFKGEERSIRWSPDGRRLAFLTRLGPDGRRVIGIVELMRGRVEPLTFAVGAQAGFAWAPDGRRIAFVGADSRLYVKADGAGPREVASFVAAGGAWPAWSPDGAWIAFVAGGRWPSAELYVVRPDGTGRRRLAGNVFAAPNAFGLSDLTWSPDGRQIAYLGAEQGCPVPCRGSPGAGPVHVVSLDGGEPRSLRVDGPVLGWPAR